MSPNFEKAQLFATKLLLLQNLNSLYIDIRKFKFDRPIIIDSYQHYAEVTHRPFYDFFCDEQNGCGVFKLKSGLNVILYDDYESCEERKHWGIVHEVGHIYLGHNSDEKIEEIEAHFFTAQITMPEIALLYAYKCQGKLTAEDIHCNFNASLESANRRIHTLTHKIKSFNRYDKILLEKLKPCIENAFAPFDESSLPF